VTSVQASTAARNPYSRQLITATLAERARSTGDLRLQLPLAAGRWHELRVDRRGHGDVRLVSESGEDTVMSRAEAVLTALRSLVARERRSLRAIARAA